MMDAESQRTSRRFRNAADPLIFALAALVVTVVALVAL